MRIELNINHHLKGEVLLSNPAFETQVSRLSSALSSSTFTVTSLTEVNSSLSQVIASGGDVSEAVDAAETADAGELSSVLDAAGVPPVSSSLSGVSSSISGVSSSISGVSTSVSSSLSSVADSFDDGVLAAPAD